MKAVCAPHSAMFGNLGRTGTREYAWRHTQKINPETNLHNAILSLLVIVVVIITWTVKFDFDFMLEHGIRGIHT